MKRIKLIKWRTVFILLACALMVTPQLVATIMLQMNLESLSQRADRIFRGTVVDVIPGSVTVGGGEIPTTTYLLQVEELFKGTADIVKEDVQIIRIQMVGSLKEIPAQGDYQRFSVFRDVPRLEMRHDYLLFTTQPSPIGLSTTVGLGQGAFNIFARNKEDFAVNEFNNVGLGLEASGPVAYSELAAKIRTLVGN
ncbi:MAG: hypothetical protein GTO24_24015 [candidate division Zixibacteria bacterium]|nr:hypothetical protein [candidate division Zixibacteria bacterium]